MRLGAGFRNMASDARERVPDVGNFTRDMRDGITRTSVWQFRAIIMLAFIAALGGSLLISGLVLLPIFGFMPAIYGVVTAGTMISFGFFTILTIYIYLTI